MSALEITNECEPAAEEMSAQVAAVEWELSGGKNWGNRRVAGSGAVSMWAWEGLAWAWEGGRRKNADVYLQSKMFRAIRRTRF